MDPEDKQRLKRYRAGDTTALEELIEAYRRPLFAFILRMGCPPNQAEDLFQDVWLRALRTLPRFRGDRLLSWLFRIAHNRVIDLARAARPHLSLQAESDNHASLGNQLASPDPTPDRQADHDDLRQRVRAAVDQLPADQRAVFLMRTEADLSFKEIARIQHTSINTALGRMHYAVEKLRLTLATDYAAYRR